MAFANFNNIARVIVSISNTPAILMNDNLVPILDAFFKAYLPYRSFLGNIQTKHTAKDELLY